MSLNADMNLTQRHRGTEDFLRNGGNQFVKYFKHFLATTLSLCASVLSTKE